MKADTLKVRVSIPWEELEQFIKEKTGVDTSNMFVDDTDIYNDNESLNLYFEAN